MTHFIYTHKSKQSQLVERNDYFECCRKNIPQAVIELGRGRWSHIKIDLITTDRELTDSKIEEMVKYIKTLIRELKTSGDFPKRGAIWYSVGEYTFISKVPTAIADEIMKHLLTYYDDLPPRNYSFNKTPVEGLNGN